MKTPFKQIFTRVFLFVAGLGLFSTEMVSAQADCSKKWGVDSVQTIQNISLYREFFKQKNFAAALEPWRYVFEQAPCSREQTHIDGIAMFKDRLKAQKDSVLRTPLLDTLLLIYDARAKFFPKSASNALGRKAVDMLDFIPGQNQRIREAFEVAVQVGGQATEPFVLGYYFKVAIKEYKGGALNQDQIFDLYNQLTGIADANLANPSLDSTKRLRYTENKAALDADLSISVIENCDQILKNFEAKFTAGNPQPALGIELARRFHKSNRTKEADTYYQEALKLVSDDSVKAQYTLDYAALFSEDKQYDKARELALQANALRPNWGKPLLFIGNLYAASYNVCGGGGISAQAVYWAAVDKFKQAARTNPALQTECDQLVDKYSGYFPKKETLFFNNPPYKGGDAYRVGCWIQESTSVRTSD